MSSACWTQLTFPEDALKGVQAAPGYRSTFGRLASHPYNVNRPDLSVWWLFRPAKRGLNWPAYHCGKFVFSRTRSGDAMRVGLHVEKGVGAALAQAYGSGRGRSFEMTDGWVWHSFLADIGNGRLEAALATIREQAGREPEITLDVGAPLAERGLHETYTEYRFRCPAGDRLVLCSFREEQQKIPFAENAMNLSDLEARLRSLATPEGDMRWVDLVVGLDIPFRTEATGDPWGGADIWEKVLEPLSPWVRGSR